MGTPGPKMLHAIAARRSGFWVTACRWAIKETASAQTARLPLKKGKNLFVPRRFGQRHEPDGNALLTHQTE